MFPMCAWWGSSIIYLDLARVALPLSSMVVYFCGMVILDLTDPFYFSSRLGYLSALFLRFVFNKITKHNESMTALIHNCFSAVFFTVSDLMKCLFLP
jgi:hypothetical protein